MEDQNSKSERTINCFICLKTLELDNASKENSNGEGRRRSVSLNSLRRCLQINTEKIFEAFLTDKTSQTDNSSNVRAFLLKDKKETKLEVDLCNPCKDLISRFTDSFSTLEMIQMEVNYWMERIHQKISEASDSEETKLAPFCNVKQEQRLLNEDRRDNDAVADIPINHQFIFLQKLRKKILERSLKMRTGLQLRVKLTRMEIGKSAPSINPSANSFPSSSQIGKEKELSSPDSMNMEADEENKDNGIDESEEYESETEAPETTFDEEYYEDSKSSSEVTSPPLLPLPQSPAASISVSAQPSKDVSSNSNKEKSSNFKQNHRPVVRISEFNPQTRKYKCRACSKEFESRNGCWLHHNAIHKKTKFKCDICQHSSFTKRNSLTEHKRVCKELQEKRISKELERSKDPRLRFQCIYCRKKFITKSRLTVHVKRVHFNERNFVCELCSNKYKSSESLNNHKNEIHFGIKYNCDVCDKQYQSKKSWLKHKKKCRENAKKNLKMEIQEK